MMNSALRQTLTRPLIRQAQVPDLLSCAAILNDYIDATAWLPRVLDRQAIADMFSPALLEKRIIFVAENGDEIIGYLSMDHEAGFVHALYVHPDARGEGLGKALLDAARQARPQGFELTVFEPNADALRFYTREGLVEVPDGRKTDTDEGVPTLLLRWKGSAQ